MIRNLVTGGAGFIGSHLVDRLLARGEEVVVLDDLSSGSFANVPSAGGRLVFLERDVALPFIEGVVPRKIDRVFNLACPASPVFYQRDPVKTTRTCVLGALSVLDYARERGIPVLQASTSEVYGDPEVHPQTESYRGNVNPIGPRSCYDEGKRCAESLFFDYRRQHGVDARVVRIFNTYGPRMAVDDGRVVSNFVAQALRGDPITVYGDGSQTRSFCFVDDTVEALLRAMDADGSWASTPVNVGNPVEFTMLELARAVVELVGSASEIVFEPLPVDDPRQRRPDVYYALVFFSGWRPRVSLEEGLRRTVDYFRRVLSTSDARITAPASAPPAHAPT